MTLTRPLTRRCAVLGDPIAHSLSPVLHRAAYDATGLAWTYDAERVPSGGLGEFLDGLDASWRGLSLTMPLKREVLPLLTEVSDLARTVGAVNTVVLEDGERHGDNTDVPGAVAAIHEKWPSPLTEVTVLGGGATAASTAWAACDLGATSVRLLVRSPERAEETAAVVRSHPAGPTVVIGPLDDEVTGDLVISTIPAEAQTEDLLARCAGIPVFFDVIYHPWPTPLAASAGTRVVIGGFDFLVHQAALQFEIFTGLPAPLDEMRAAGEQALA